MIEVSPGIYPEDPSMHRIVNKVRKFLILFLKKEIYYIQYEGGVCLKQAEGTADYQD